MAYLKREDQLAAQRRHYQKNPQYYLERNKKRKRELRRWFREIRATRGCQTCAEDHPACLEFHHVGKKTMEVSLMVDNGRAKANILAEIEKCILLCSNCHRKLHFRP